MTLLRDVERSSAFRLREQSGQALVIVTMMLTLLVAVSGLTVDYGRQVVRYREAKNATDAAALGAAYQIGAGSNLSGATSQANILVQQGGFAISCLTVTYLNSSGLATSDPAQVATVQASIAESSSTTFMRVLGIDTMSVSALSEASTTGTGGPCAVCVLNPSVQGALELSSNGSITVTGGAVAVNSSDYYAAAILESNGSVTAPSIGVVGGYKETSNGRFHPTPIHISPVADPLAGVPVPTCPVGNPTGSGSVVVTTSPMTINPGSYNSITVSSNAKLTLNPGIYCITNSAGISVTSNGPLVANGVMIYFTCGSYTNPAPCTTGQKGGAIQLSSNGNVQMSAPTSGSYKGMSIFFDRKNTSKIWISSNGGSFTGTIYANAAQLQLSSNGGTQQMNSTIVVNTVKISNGGINNRYTPAANYVVGRLSLTE